MARPIAPIILSITILLILPESETIPGKYPRPGLPGASGQDRARRRSDRGPPGTALAPELREFGDQEPDEEPW
jgi:hypothetical protein